MRRVKRRSGRFRFSIVLIITAAVAAVILSGLGGHRKVSDHENSSRGQSGFLQDGSGTGNSGADFTGGMNSAISGSSATAADRNMGDEGPAALEPPAVSANDAGAAGRGGSSETAGENSAAGRGGSSETAGDESAAAADNAADTGVSMYSPEISYGSATSAPSEPVIPELERGRNYLKSLDRRQPYDVDSDIERARALYEQEKVREAYLDKRKEYSRTLEGSAVWDAFDDCVLLGDSRVVGFDVFGYLPSERVLAAAGDTINNIPERTDEIRDLSPKYIFISYGINDIGIGFWPTAEDYTAAFGEKIEELKDEFPESVIFVNSIIPATDEAVRGVPVWGGIPSYSEAVRGLCREKKIPFIDNAGLMEDHSDLYAEDGVHLKTEFYPYWARNLLLGIYDLQHGRTSDGFLIEEE